MVIEVCCCDDDFRIPWVVRGGFLGRRHDKFSTDLHGPRDFGVMIDGAEVLDAVFDVKGQHLKLPHVLILLPK